MWVTTGCGFNTSLESFEIKGFSKHGKRKCQGDSERKNRREVRCVCLCVYVHAVYSTKQFLCMSTGMIHLPGSEYACVFSHFPGSLPVLSSLAKTLLNKEDNHSLTLPTVFSLSYPPLKHTLQPLNLQDTRHGQNLGYTYIYMYIYTQNESCVLSDYYKLLDVFYEELVLWSRLKAWSHTKTTWQV